MGSTAIDVLTDQRDQLGECPVWSGRDSRLYWVDIDGCTVHRHDPTTGGHEATTVPARPGSFALTNDPGRLLVAMEHELVDLDFETGEVTPRAILEPEGAARRLNDGRVDPSGRFWVGSMDDPWQDGDREANLHRIDPDGRTTTVKSGIGISNALAFSPDGTRMYFGDTTRSTVWTYDFDVDSGTPTNEQVFLDFGDLPGRPDGACVDESGCLWVAAVYGWAVLRVTPAGEVDRVVELPVEKPTMPCFGGAGLDTMYITSISSGGTVVSAEAQPLAGAVFVVDPNTRGVPEPLYAG